MAPEAVPGEFTVTVDDGSGDALVRARNLVGHFAPGGVRQPVDLMQAGQPDQHQRDEFQGTVR